MFVPVLLACLIRLGSNAAAPESVRATPAMAQESLEKTAPDGHAGLGASADAQQLLHMFRSPSDQEQQLLQELARLSTDVSILCGDLIERYREWGYLDVRSPYASSQLGHELDGLHAGYERDLGNAAKLLTQPGEHAQLLARLIVDTRFNVRRNVLAGWEFEAREIRSGLAVLRAAADSYVQVSEREARMIAARVDFAAARLRALRLDLGVLRPRADESASRSAIEKEAAALLQVVQPDPKWSAKQGQAAAAQRLSQYLDAARALEGRMSAELFTFKLWPRMEGQFDARQEDRKQAARLREEAARTMPGKRANSASDPTLARMATDERMRLTFARSTEGLSRDPLDEELAYMAAHAADFSQGDAVSRPLYDRYLVLRGIRHFDHKTLEGRQLTDLEREALDKVQGLGAPVVK